MYKIEYNDRVIESVAKIPANIRKSIKRAIEERLATDPVKFGKPLKGEWQGCYRLRVGDFRIIYEIHESVITVLIVKISHRSNVYK